MSCPVKGASAGPRDVGVEDLVALARSGDRDAFAEIYRRFYDRVAGWLARRVDNRSEVDDLAQGVFVRVLSELPTYEPREGSPFAAWLIGAVARCELVAFQKRRWAHREAVTQQRDALVRCGPLDIPGQSADGVALSAVVATALARLSPARRRCVQLRYLDGLPETTTAEETGKTRAAVNNNCTRALKQLRGELAALRPAPRKTPPAGAVLLTTREAALRAGYHESTIRYAILDRGLTAYWVDRQWRIPMEALDAYLDKHQPDRFPVPMSQPGGTSAKNSRRAGLPTAA